jgi:hypothetical protein
VKESKEDEQEEAAQVDVFLLVTCRVVSWVLK